MHEETAEVVKRIKKIISDNMLFHDEIIERLEEFLLTLE
jgi:hypothetical protein